MKEQKGIYHVSLRHFRNSKTTMVYLNSFPMWHTAKFSKVKA